MSWRKRPVPRHPPHGGRSRSQHPAGEAGAVLTKHPRPGSRKCFRKGRTGTVSELRRNSGASGSARAPGTERPCAPLPADQHGLWRSPTLLPAAGGSEGPRPAEMSPALGFAPSCFSREPRRGESGLSEPRAPQASVPATGRQASRPRCGRGAGGSRVSVSGSPKLQAHSCDKAAPWSPGPVGRAHCLAGAPPGGNTVNKAPGSRVTASWPPELRPLLRQARVPAAALRSPRTPGPQARRCPSPLDPPSYASASLTPHPVSLFQEGPRDRVRGPAHPHAAAPAPGHHAQRGRWLGAGPQGPQLRGARADAPGAWPRPEGPPTPTACPSERQMAAPVTFAERSPRGWRPLLSQPGPRLDAVTIMGTRRRDA